MIPAVRLPADFHPLPSIDVRLKPDWEYEEKGFRFRSVAGAEFVVPKSFPKRAKIICKAGPLMAKGAKPRSAGEAELRRHLAIILPQNENAADWLDEVRRWPMVGHATLPPEISLPGGRSK